MEVTTTPAGAALVLDGKTLSQRTPARLENLTPGQTHVLLVHLDGQKGVAQRFTLDAGEEASMEIDLHRNAPPKPIARAHGHGGGDRAVERERAAHPVAAPTPTVPAPPPAPVPAVRPQGEGMLVVASSPWCNVSVDGQPRGTTPLSLKLKAGPHAVVLSNPEFHISRTLSVEVQPGQTVRKSLDFAPE
jgi:hypothetical protein